MKDRIKKVRKDQGLTQQKLADLFGVKRNTVAQWETGANAITNQTLEQYVKAFNLNREWLETGFGEMYRKTDDIERTANVVNAVMDADTESDLFALMEMLSNSNDEKLIHQLRLIAEILAK